MHLAERRFLPWVCGWVWVCALAVAAPAAAQTVQGVVVDGANGRPVPQAGVYLLDRDHTTLLAAMADSLGRYTLTAPGAGEYFLVAQRFGYRDTETPLLGMTGDRTYGLDLELRPEPLGLGGVTVTVRNEQAVEWLTREIGVNPSAAFGFRLLQGDRLAEAKVKGRNDPTETLRWLYIPVSHAGACVSINAVPRAVRSSWTGPRPGQFDSPIPAGTTSLEKMAEAAQGGASCGTLRINDRVVPNEHIDEVDMSSIAVVITMLNEVRMYTYDFDWTFRGR